MITEIIPQIYDTIGKQIAKPISRKRKHKFIPHFPVERYLSEPLVNKFNDLNELRKFLSRCKYVSDKELFGVEDFWMPPETFEKIMKGDCDDFSIYAWRQLLEMGYDARYVVGLCGKYQEGHAWVTFSKDKKIFILEPLAAHIGMRLPKLSAIRYEPQGSVAWNGKNVSYYIHEKRQIIFPLYKLPWLIAAWLLFWIWWWFKFAGLVCLLPFAIVRKKVRNRLYNGSRR
ncbi:MAG: hypothetical protein A2Y07_10850 [Planctomycetes bacterium GWF2_50_10]|nr:MAG: hypothetical protein A2Y07_10850 [Planctomycetes bacterium GWF2_50_10]